MVGDFADGAWCCELAATPDRDSMLTAVVVHPSGGRAPG